MAVGVAGGARFRASSSLGERVDAVRWDWWQDAVVEVKSGRMANGGVNSPLHGAKQIPQASRPELQLGMTPGVAARGYGAAEAVPSRRFAAFRSEREGLDGAAHCLWRVSLAGGRLGFFLPLFSWVGGGAAGPGKTGGFRWGHPFGFRVFRGVVRAPVVA